MSIAATPVDAALIRVTLDWWALAGVDQLIDEEPVAWLARGKPSPVAARKSAPAAPPVPLPKSLAEMVAFLSTDPSLPQAGPPERRLAASGNPASDLMVVIDMPEQGDHQAGHLISGEAGVLFDNMLRALKRDRETCYIAAICPGRPAGGILPESAWPRLAELARQHIVFAAPKKLWLMGQTVSRAILGMDFAQARSGLQNFNQDGANVEAVVSFSPRMLLQSPNRKRAAWNDMQMLLGELKE